MQIVQLYHMKCVHRIWRRQTGKDRAGGFPQEVWAESWYVARQEQPPGTWQWVFLPGVTLYCQCPGHGRHLLHISRRNDCQTQLPSSSPRGWQHHLGNCCDKKHTALTSPGLGGLCPFHRGCFCSQGGAGAGRTLHTWISVLWITHSTWLLHTFTAVVPPHATIVKNLITILGHQKYFKHIHEVLNKIVPKKESYCSVPTWPSQDTKHSIVLWEIKKKSVTFNTSINKALIFSSTTLLTSQELFLDQFRSCDPAKAGLQERREDCSQEPRAHGSNPSAIRHWLYTSFQNEVPERRLNRAW